MVILTNISFGKKNLYEAERSIKEIFPVPGYMIMMGPYIKSVESGGDIQAINLFEFDESRLAEARDFINDRMAAYHNLVRLTYSVDLWFDAKDVLKMIESKERRMTT